MNNNNQYKLYAFFHIFMYKLPISLKNWCGKIHSVAFFITKQLQPMLHTRNSARHSKKSIKTQIAPSIRTFIYTLQGYLCYASIETHFLHIQPCILNQAGEKGTETKAISTNLIQLACTFTDFRAGSPLCSGSRL